LAISVPVDIDLQIKKAIEDTNDLVSGVNKSLGGIEKQAKATGLAVSGIAFVEITRAAIDFGKTLVSVFEKAIEEAIDADNAIQGLSSSMKAAGDFSEQNVRVFEDLAKSLAAVSRFSDEAVLDAFRIGKQFGLSNRETAKFGKAAVELASFLGQDLETTARQLGQTFDGTAGRIAEQVPALRGLSEEALRAGGALDVVLKVAGGSAVRDLDKFSVQVEKLKQAFGDIFEELGSSIVKNPALINSLKIIGGLFRDIAVAIGENDQIFRSFISGSLSSMVKGFYVVSQVVEAVNSAFFKLAKFLEPAVQALEAFDKATEALKKGDIRGFARSLDVVTATRDRFKEIDKLAERDAKIFDKFNTALSEVQAAIDKAADGQERLTKEAEKTGLQFDKNGDKSNRQAESYAQMMERIKAAQAGAFERLKKNTTELEKQTEELKKQHDAERERIADIVKNPVKAISSNRENTLKLDLKTQEATAAMTGVVTNALQGRQGAVNLISAGAEAAGRMLLGVPGFGEIAKLLSQGPEATKAAVKEFLKAIPDIIDAIIDSIPEIVDAFIEELPRLIEKAIERLPKILVAAFKSSVIIKAIAALFSDGFRQAVGQFIDGAGRFIDELVRGAGTFIQKLIDELVKAIGQVGDALNPFSGSNSGVGGLVGGIGDVLGGIGSSIGSVFGFKGGESTSSLISAGSGFQSKGSAGGGFSQGPQVVKVQIGQRDLATAILDLNRQGFRT